MDLISEIVARAKANPQRIVLPEGTEERTLKAADRVLAEGNAKLIILGNRDEIMKLANEWGLNNINKATIIDPENNEKKETYANLLYELRKSKGMSLEEARHLVLNPLYLGCLLVKNGDADGQLAGAKNTTGDVLRPALQIIKTTPGISTVSGAMLLITRHKEFGKEGVLVVGDVAVTPVPTAEQLAQIAVCTAHTTTAVVGTPHPKVAMLSFSTKGSAKHEVVNKAVEATRMAKEMDPNIIVDGEMQTDAALIPSIGERKAPGSPVAGHADVLIFPNLEVGNIGYKLAERLGDIDAVGPILQGMAQPVNDLSRGCSTDDIYKMVSITASQAIAAQKRRNED